MLKGESVYYEWAMEDLDEYDDITEVNHTTDTREALAWMRDREASGDLAQLALTRRVGSDAEGETRRGYAYVEGTALPGVFDCGAKVPKRFRDEMAAWVTASQAWDASVEATR